MTGAAASVTISPMLPEHAAKVLTIYQAGIDEGDATFETTAPTWERFDAAKLADHRYVALGADNADNGVLGWIAATAVSDRCVYAGVVEHSVYVHPDARGQGVGAALLRALIASTEAAGIWTVQSGIFPENAASLALHRRCGFRVVGTRERIGQHHGVWRDVLLIERRSGHLPDRDEPCEAGCDEQRWRTAPVSCSLGADDLGARTEAWRALVAGAGRERIPDGVRLRLPVDRAAAVAELAAAEQACCPFFDFRIHLDGPSLYLEVRAPAEASALVESLIYTPAV